MKEINEEVRVFGVPFDPPNSPERLNLKLGYVYHSLNTGGLCDGFHDPYDVIQTDLKSRFLYENTWMGKMPVDTWLTPRPQVSDLPMLTGYGFTSFLEKNGCWDYAMKVAEFVEKRVFPYRPVMIGVDHSLTGGLLLALARRDVNLNVVILDAHFDVMKFDGFAFDESKRKRPFYQCGNFISHVLGKGIIRPENLWVLGVNDEFLRAGNGNYRDSSSSDNISEIKKWMDRGVHVLSKQDVVSGVVSIDLKGPTYVSIDMDIGSLSSVFAARFMNCYGLSADEFLQLLSKVAASINKSDVPLVGLDVMEIDIHFLEAAEETPFHDYTRHIVSEIFRLFLERDRCDCIAKVSA